MEIFCGRIFIMHCISLQKGRVAIFKYSVIFKLLVTGVAQEVEMVVPLERDL